jgi:hypothetical protein
MQQNVLSSRAAITPVLFQAVFLLLVLLPAAVPPAQSWLHTDSAAEVLLQHAVNESAAWVAARCTVHNGSMHLAS